MNKQIKKYVSFIFIISLLMGGATSVYAQDNDAVKKRDIRDKAYNVIANGYDAYASVNGSESYYEFLRLFANEEVPVYNDLLGLSSAKSMAVGDYARLLNSNEVSTKRITIKNIQLEGEPRKEEGKWIANVSFDKEMSYYTKCKVYFSSREFYQADYHLTATISYDEVDGRCRIERIDGTIASSNKLPERYFVFNQTDQRDQQLLFQNQTMLFNSNRQAIVSGTFDANGFTHPQVAQEKLNPTINDCNIATMSYGRRTDEAVSTSDELMCLRLHYAFGLGNALSLTANNGVSSDKASGSNIGLDFGYTFMQNDMLTLRGFAGIGISMYSLDFGYGPYEKYYDLPGTADVDGDAYRRYYEGLNISQSIKLTDLSIPIYADAEIKINDMFSAYADLGLQFNFNMSHKTEIGKATADKIYGRYSQYNNLKIYDDWGYNDFSNNTTALSNATTEDITGVKSMTMDLLGGIGVRCNIPNSPIAIDLGLDMRFGLGDIATPDKVTDNKLVEYTAKYPSNGTEHLYLTNEIEKIKRSSLRLNIGVIYKF